jgi:hypothetical protein
VLGDFVEITPFSSVLIHLFVNLIFLWFGLVVGRMFSRVVFIMLWLLCICKPEIHFFPVLKFLLNFGIISIRNT